jgi:coenzyme F420-reducing hydrogenase gamma subunit
MTTKDMPANGGPKIAFFDFTSCEGCQLTVVDSLQTHPELLQVVEIVQFREAMSEKGENYQVAFIEGSCTRQGDEERLKQIRQQAAVVVALGTCAHLGGVNALKALHPLDEVRQYVYGDKADWYDTYDARPIEAVIPVDFAIPGCPIDRDEFLACVKALLLGKKPPIPDYPLCVECKLKENTCLYTLGKICMGPVTRAGCKAICPSYGQSCEACRGFISHPNDSSMRNVMAEHGTTPEDITSMYTMFTTYQVRQKLMQGKS